MSAFDDIAAHLDYPLFIVTAAHDAERAGCLVGFATQISIDPVRFLVGLSSANHTTRVAEQARHLAVHVVDTEHVRLATLFGTESGDEVDKFSRCAWTLGPHGIPVLDDSAAWFVGRIIDVVPLGDHTAYVLDPQDGAVNDLDRPLLGYGDLHGVDAGHSP